ncbi:hypothetical protein ACTXI9_01725 [Brachybacterium alimentarium]|uniref:hypothetical protein n=1 Tax=Brachybacterium alimentarium TaxID=47845 RepID=UPI003FD16307
MTTEQRRALAKTIPTNEVIRDAVTFPRDRLGEPLDISPERFDAWLAQVRRDAARAALDGLAEAAGIRAPYLTGPDGIRHHRDHNYPEETP